MNETSSGIALEEQENTITFSEVHDENFQMFCLPIYEELMPEDTYPITASENSNFFVIIGGTGSGKTTLITSIYHLFLTGTYKEKFMFAGSQTLSAFEARAFYLRTSSENTHVKMRRTPVGSGGILHIRLKIKQQNDFTNLLFSDFSGEDLSNIVANIDAVKEDFKIVNSASHLVVLIDGEKIANMRYRISELQKMIQILRTFWDGGVINNNAKIIIVVSKYDLLIDKAGNLKDPFSQSIIERILEQLPELKGRLLFNYIASMPTETTILKAGYGVDQLLESLFNPSNPILSNSDTADNLKSQFNMWKGRLA